MNGFTFNGTTSQSLGLLVTALNPYNSASRRVETIEIPYRNGNLIIDSGTYDNIMVSYEVSVIGNTKNTCDAINEWLSGSQGYCILSDTYNTEFFRVGYFASSIEYVLTALYRYGKATINFDCFPQKYLNSNSTITRSATSTTTTDDGGTFSSKVYPLPIDLKGNTTQTTYSGKNLEQGIEQGGIDSNGADYLSTTVIRSKYYNDVSPSTQYIISMNGSVTSVNVAEYNSSKGFLSFTFRSGAFTTSATTKYIRISKTATVNDKFQIEQGSTVTPYEPYVGGMPSPNQSYPQTIHTVSGDNDILVMGKNLISNVDIYNGYAYANDGATLTYISSDKTITYKKTAKVMAGKQYPLSWKPNTPKLISMRDIKIADDDAKQLQNIQYSNSNNVKSVSFTPTYSGWVYACLDANATEPMLEVGSTATTYEEYKGITYHFRLPVENLVDASLLSTTNSVNIASVVNGEAITDAMTGYAGARIDLQKNISLSAGDVIYVSFKLKSSTDNDAFNVIQLMDASNHVIEVTNTNILKPITNTYFQEYRFKEEITSDVTLTRMFFQHKGSTSEVFTIKELQVSYVQGSYTPYGTSPIELCKIGNYQDYFYKNGSKWYLHKETKRIVVNENSQVWRERATSPYIFAMQVNDYKRTQENICVCDYFTSAVNGSYARMQNGEVKFRYYNDTQNRLYFCTADYSTLSDFTTWLSTHNVTVIYALRTATNTEITDATLLSQLNAIDNVMAFETSTTIAQVNNDAPFLLTYTNIGSSNFSSNYRGEPIITVNETGIIYWNGEVIKVNAPMTINSKTMQCYDGTENLNSEVELNEFPMLKKGNNDIGSTMALSIVPNYWKL